MKKVKEESKQARKKEEGREGEKLMDKWMNRYLT